VRLAAVVLGCAAFGGLIVLAVAGVSGATAVLVTGGAVVAMIGLGNAVGARHTPNRTPFAAGPLDVPAGEDVPDVADAPDLPAGADGADVEGGHDVEPDVRGRRGTSE
jgi:hypothetical protein